MDREEFFEAIFKSLKECIDNTDEALKVIATHCSGIYITFYDKANKQQTYTITIAQKNK